MYFVDTNILLSNLDLLTNEDKFYISSVTLEEIENIKTNKFKTDELRYSARTASRWLRKNLNKFATIICTDDIDQMITDRKLSITPDNRICACAKYVCDNLEPNIMFCTNDLNCANIAQDIFGLHTLLTDEMVDTIYKGYREIKGNSEYINNYISNTNDFIINEYLIINNTDDNSQKEMRWDGEKFVALKLPPSKYIKGKNALQRCALDILNNPDITIAAILGGFGSGKSYLTMRMALYHVNEKGNQSRILGIREPSGEGREVGFLPGSLEEKTDNFFLPLLQQLEGGEFELEQLKQRGILESNIPYYLKGTTYMNTVMLVDEAEDLDEKQIRLVGTRVGENSRIFLDGDYKQSVINASKSNALVKMCNAFKGNPKFGCIYLGEDVRSSTSKMFATLFE